MPEKDQKSPKPDPPAAPASPASFQAPRGTRDFYPEEQARRRHLFETWRRSALRHAFDEIDGPTFEHLDLYTVKSGDAIVSELFSFERQGGEQRYALRPEFTPTLARMVAARAHALPKPIMWFSIANYFRAERPQRGRLREFAQWNVDVLGDDSPKADAMCIACCVEALRSFGLDEEDVRVRINHRDTADWMFHLLHIGYSRHADAMRLFDAREKMPADEFKRRLRQIGGSVEEYESYESYFNEVLPAATTNWYSVVGTYGFFPGDSPEAEQEEIPECFHELEKIKSALRALGVLSWCDFAPGIFRGLDYYTGTVFEVHEAGGKERAIAGGGRYDGLVELFGGPPTPAVGFAMGDVVLSLVLEDKGLTPSGAELLESINARPDAFLIAASESADESLEPTLATLRAQGIHARRSHRSTRNVGKLLKDAEKSHARCAVILEDSGAATIKDLDTAAQQNNIPLDTLAEKLLTSR